MGQYFMLMAPKIRSTSGSLGKLGECLFDGTPQCLIDLLVVPIWPDDFSTNNAKPALTRSPDQLLEVSDAISQTQHLTSLPVELVELVCTHLDATDVLNLGLTNHLFRNIAVRHIHKIYMASLGQWAGQSIICDGDYTSPDDYPPGMFTEDERQELSQYKDNNGMAWNLYELSYEENIPLPFKDWGHRAAKALHQKLQSQLSLGLASLWMTGPRSTREMSFSVYNKMRDTLAPDLSRFYPATQSWILRNLTTKEIVRAEEIALKSDHIDGPNIKYLGFGQVIMSRISWSTSPGVNMSYEGDIHRGVWAGHCFDIRTVESHLRITKEEAGEWKDVSDEVAKEIGEIWESEYGEG